jgi:CubicO group peptidase (beta-lactamase class C family)
MPDTTDQALPTTDRAAIDGWLHPDFDGVATALRGLLRSNPGGAAVCVYHRGRCVVDLWGGVRSRAGAAWTQDTMAPSFSTTKGVAATLLHIAVDRGLLDYDDRVAAHWPEFAQAGKDAITVRHVLAHQSGLYHIRQMIDRADRMLDWDHMIRAIERTAPIHEPGTRTGYHGLTFGYIVGELLQRVTGRSFSRLVQDELVRPLGLDGMYVGAPDEALARAAELLWPMNNVLAPVSMLSQGGIAGTLLSGGAGALQGVLRLFGLQLDLASILDALAPNGINSFDFGAADTLKVAIPAANGLFTARSLARMYAALSCGGEIDGVRLLSPATLARATQIQDPVAGRVVIPFDMRWRLGYHAVATTRGVPKKAFGHFGFGGSGAWADPRRELAVALIVNSGLGTPFGDTRIMRISGAALACASSRPRPPVRATAPAARPALVYVPATSS